MDSSKVVVWESWEALSSWTLLTLPYPVAGCPSHCGARAQLGLCGSYLASWPSWHGHHPITSGTRGFYWHCGPHKALGSGHLWTFPACIRLQPCESRQHEPRSS